MADLPDLAALGPVAAQAMKELVLTALADLLERMEDHNEVAVWPACPIDLKPDVKRALEQHMAAALFGFFETNNLWTEFRGLEHIGDLEWPRRPPAGARCSPPTWPRRRARAG